MQIWDNVMANKDLAKELEIKREEISRGIQEIEDQLKNPSYYSLLRAEQLISSLRNSGNLSPAIEADLNRLEQGITDAQELLKEQEANQIQAIKAEEAKLKQQYENAEKKAAAKRKINEDRRVEVEQLKEKFEVDRVRYEAIIDNEDELIDKVLRGDALTPEEEARLTGNYGDNEEEQKWKMQHEKELELQRQQFEIADTIVEKDEECLKYLDERQIEINDIRTGKKPYSGVLNEEALIKLDEEENKIEIQRQEITAEKAEFSKVLNRREKDLKKIKDMIDKKRPGASNKIAEHMKKYDLFYSKEKNEDSVRELKDLENKAKLIKSKDNEKFDFSPEDKQQLDDIKKNRNTIDHQDLQQSNSSPQKEVINGKKMDKQDNLQATISNLKKEIKEQNISQDKISGFVCDKLEGHKDTYIGAAYGGVMGDIVIQKLYRIIRINLFQKAILALLQLLWLVVEVALVALVDLGNNKYPKTQEI